MLKAFHKRMQDDRGFTLIELMVVVLIIAILIAIAIPTFLGLRTRAQDRAAQSDLRNALTAAKAYYTDNDSYTGFSDLEGDAIEPSLEWNMDATSTPGQVSVRAVTDDTVLVSTESNSGTIFCMVDNAGQNDSGTGEQTVVANCTGGF